MYLPSVMKRNYHEPPTFDDLPDILDTDKANKVIQVFNKIWRQLTKDVKYGR